MIPTPTVGPLWGSENTARADILEGDVWGALKSQKSKRRHDSKPYCMTSLGLGNRARAELLEGDTLGSTEIAEFQAAT